MTAHKLSPLVPKLRFPEFRSRRGWPFTRLSAAMEEHGVKSDGTSEVYSVSLAKGIVPQVEHMGRSFAASDTAHYNLVRPFDVVYTRSPLAIFKLGIVKQHRGVQNAIVSPLYGVFTPRNRHLGLIIEAYFDSPSRSIQFLDPLAQKGAKNTIQLSNDRFLSGALHLPQDEDEQQKIADCLGSLDDLIAAEGRKLEILRQHKRGLMQQLFPLPGETQPLLRFPEFADSPEWEPRELGPMTSKIGSGVTPPGGDKNYQSTGRPFIRSQNIGWGELILDDVAHIDEDIHNSFAATELKVGDVLLNITGASIGRSAVADARIACGNVNQHVCIIRVVSDQIHSWFLSQYLISRHGQEQIDSCQAGGNRQGLNFAQIRSFVIPQPTLIAEQERIADCLCAADACLAIQVQTVSALKSHKHGLLQQLFPSLEVVES